MSQVPRCPTESTSTRTHAGTGRALNARCHRGWATVKMARWRGCVRGLASWIAVTFRYPDEPRADLYGQACPGIVLEDCGWLIPVPPGLQQWVLNERSPVGGLWSQMKRSEAEVPAEPPRYQPVRRDHPEVRNNGHRDGRFVNNSAKEESVITFALAKRRILSSPSRTRTRC